MARITVEDCLDHVDNRFELVLLATKRTRQLTNGQESKVEWDNDKPTVVALREIASGLITNSNIAAQNVSRKDDEDEFSVRPEGSDAE